MSTAVEELVLLMEDPDPFQYAPEEIADLQVRAIDERLVERRDEIKVLQLRARDTGVDRVGDLRDAVPVLFADSIYKSYPEAFVTAGKWDAMCRWLSTMSTRSVDGVDLEGIADVDDWIGRLQDAGHYVFASSGTSGKASLLDHTSADRETRSRGLKLAMAWGFGIKPGRDRAVFVLGPSSGAHLMVDAMRQLGDAFGGPGRTFFLSDRAATVAETNRLGSLRRAIAEGRAAPSEIAQATNFAAERQAEMRGSVQTFVDALCAHRGEPVVLFGMWQQLWLVVQEARARGLGDGAFHPDTAINVGGGLKGAELPDDYEAQIGRFFGIDASRFQNFYGFSELNCGPFPTCRARRWHPPPWVVVFVLDEVGERILNPAAGSGGVVEGRMAFFDVSVDAYWGGVITGDKVSIDFSPCPCGRAGLTVLHIERYRDLPGGDDKLTCAGSMDAYVRGVVAD